MNRREPAGPTTIDHDSTESERRDRRQARVWHLDLLLIAAMLAVAAIVSLCF